MRIARTIAALVLLAVCLGVLFATNVHAQQPLGFGGAYPLVWKLDKQLPQFDPRRGDTHWRSPHGKPARGTLWWVGANDITHERWAIVVKPSARLPFKPFRLVMRPSHEIAKKGQYRLEKMKYRDKANRWFRTFDEAEYVVNAERDDTFKARHTVTGRKTWYGYEWTFKRK